MAGDADHRLRDAAGLVAGAALAIAIDRLAIRHAPRQRTALAAVGLAVAAAIYPAARTRRPLDAHLAREIAALGGYGGLAVAATRRRPVVRRRLLALVWASHAAFDAVHDTGPASLIPAWYPAACAGYDLVYAARLLGIDTEPA